MFKGYIFDLDGTLVDSKLDFNKMREEIGIPHGEPILEYLERHPDPHFVKKGLEIVHQHEVMGAQKAELIEGALQLLEELRSKNIPTGLLTRNSKVVTELTLNRFSLPLDDVLTRDDCRPKPDPEGLLILSRKWSLPVHDLVYIGDYLFDLQTAKACSMTAALFEPNGPSPFRDQADFTISCYKEFAANL